MTTLGVLLSLLSGVLWVAFDVLRKRLGERMTSVQAAASLASAQAMGFSLLVLMTPTSLTWDGASPLATWPTWNTSYLTAWAGVVALNALATVWFLRAVQLSPLSLTTPYLSFTPVFTAILGSLFHAQHPSWLGWFGIAVVCLGAFFLNPGTREEGWLAPLRALARERGSLYMLGVAMLWSATAALDLGAVKQASPLGHAAAMTLGMTVVFGVYLGGRRELGALATSVAGAWRWLVPGGLLVVGAYGVQLVSYGHLDVAYMETIKRAVGVVGAIAAGAWLLGEDVGWERLAGALVMVAGVVMIVAGHV